MPRGTAQIDDVSTWLPPSLDTPWQNVFFEYINYSCCTAVIRAKYLSILEPNASQLFFFSHGPFNLVHRMNKVNSLRRVRQFYIFK